MILCKFNPKESASFPAGGVKQTSCLAGQQYYFSRESNAYLCTATASPKQPVSFPHSFGGSMSANLHGGESSPASISALPPFFCFINLSDRLNLPADKAGRSER